MDLKVISEAIMNNSFKKFLLVWLFTCLLGFAASAADGNTQTDFYCFPLPPKHLAAKFLDSGRRGPPPIFCQKNNQAEIFCGRPADPQAMPHPPQMEDIREEELLFCQKLEELKFQCFENKIEDFFFACLLVP
jgi:hypothetical protein